MTVSSEYEHKTVIPSGQETRGTVLPDSRSQTTLAGLGASYAAQLDRDANSLLSTAECSLSPTPPRNLARAPRKLSRPVVRKQSTQPVILLFCKTQLVTPYSQEGWCTVLSHSGFQPASHINCGACCTDQFGRKFEAPCRAENSLQAYQIM